MPLLDRPIVVEQNHGMRNASGEFVDDWRTLGRMWAIQQSAGEVDVETAGGIIVSEARNYVVRWRRDLFLLSPAVVRIIDDLGIMWNVDAMSESRDRRRYLSISCQRAG